MSSIEIYKLLPEPPEDYEGDVIIQSDDTPENAKIASDNQLIKAVNMSKAAGEDPGKIPGDILRYVEELLNPKLSWDVILRNYMDSYAKDDYSWRKPNKKFPDIYLPSLYSDSIENISVLIDTSGSITDDDLKIFFTEIQAIKDSLNPEALWVGSFDTQLYKSKLFDNFTNMKLQGGGGTYSTPIKERIENSNPNILLVFSDMYMNFDSLKDVDYDHLYWIATAGYIPVVPLGTIIEYDRKQ